MIPIRTATNTALRPIPIGPAWPFVITIAITPDSKTAYVANAYTDTVTPIRTATNTALAPIKVGDGPVAIAITPDGQTAYVVSGSGPGRPGTVIPIQTATNQALRPITGRIPPRDHRDHPVATPLTRSPGRMLPGSAMTARLAGPYASQGTRP